MIQNKQVVEIQTGKSKKSAQFGMEFNPKAFSILSDSLYQYKERAVCREYCTNAYDSHMDAGYPEKPFQVHVPTELYPYFEVQDFGIGLSEEGVMKTFATFFHSTKDNDNTTNGCLGLGSKAFLAVSDQCTVTSVKDNTKNTFICHKDRQGIPTVALKNTQTTEGTNGVTIRIPVDRKNLNTWVNELVNVIAFFDVEPIHNITDTKTLDTLDRLQRQRTSIRESGVGFIDLRTDQGCKVLMGNVMYPIESPLDFVRGKKLRSFASGIMDQVSIRVNCQLGDINIAPSREALSLDPWTRKTLEHKITKLVINKYREIAGDLGGEVSSYYNFYHKFKGTPLWSIFQGMVFPFTNHRSLSHYNNDSVYSRGKSYLYPLQHLQSVRGFIPKIGYLTPSVMSTSIQGVNHERLRTWVNLYIAQGTDKRLRDTLKNAYEVLPECGGIFYASDEKEATWLQSYFNIPNENLITCEEYYTEKVRKKGNTANNRKGRGKLEDSIVLANNFTLGKTIAQFSEVNLLEGKVAYVSDKWMDIAMEGNYQYSWNSTRVKEIMKWCGVETLVMSNHNNGNKIRNNDTPSLESLWKTEVKKVQNSLLKGYAWSRRTGVSKTTDLFSHRLKTLKKLNNSYEKVSKVVDTFPNLSLSVLGLEDHKVYKKELAKVEVMNDNVRNEVKEFESKLPLWNQVRNDLDQAKYYLKLEKIIK